MKPENKRKVDYIFSSLKLTGTTITEFASLSPVSRNTLHRWKRGSKINDVLRLNIAVLQAKKLRKFRGKSKAQIAEALKTPWSI